MTLAFHARGLPKTALESPMDSFSRSDPDLWSPGDVLNSNSDVEASAPSNDITPFYIPPSTCLRTYKDTDGYDLICFCTRCQDEFLSQECFANGLQTETFTLSGSSAVVDQQSYSTGTCAENHAMITLPNSEDLPVSRPAKQVHKSPNTAGISKSVAVTQKDRPEALLKQLEEALSEDGNFSADFKWKASKHFQELKKLFENEPPTQSINADLENSSLSSDSQSRDSKSQQRQTSKEQQAEKTFLCTLSSCSYSTNSAMDWRRHEETHWPQKRYMCLKCPIVDPENPQCSFCTVSLSECESLSHYLQCSSARRNNRTFARKDKLTHHLQKDHSIPQKLAKSQALIWNFQIDSGWLKQCIFCYILFDNWEDRTQHLIEKHFKLSADHKISRSSGIILTEEERARGVTSCYYNVPEDLLSVCHFDREFTQEPAADNKAWRDKLKQFEGFTWQSAASRAAEVHKVTSNVDEKVIKNKQRVDTEETCQDMGLDQGLVPGVHCNNQYPRAAVFPKITFTERSVRWTRSPRSSSGRKMGSSECSSRRGGEDSGALSEIGTSPRMRRSSSTAVTDLSSAMAEFNIRDEPQK